MDESATEKARKLSTARRFNAGRLPLILTNEDLSLVAIYFPADGHARLDMPNSFTNTQRRYETRFGVLRDDALVDPDATFNAPVEPHAACLQDWVLLQKAKEA